MLSSKINHEQHYQLFKEPRKMHLPVRLLASHESVADALRIKVFFADPYSAWPRGLNENTNGLMSRWSISGIV